MKKILLLLVLLTALSVSACGEDGISNKSDEELVIGENAFGVHVTVKNMTDEKVRFIVDPHADEFGYGGQGEIGKGIFGTDGLVPGKKKGDKVNLDGSFTLYANDKSGPSVTIEVKGTYEIDALANDFSTMHFYLYDGGQFIKSDKDTVNK